MVGGGFTGVEFAQMYRRYGSRVSVVQRADRLVPAEDPAISEVIAEAFSDEGIALSLSTRCVAVDGEAGAIRVACEGADAAEITGTHLLIATGRTPNTDDLGIEHLELDLDDRGYVPVDKHLQTAADGVWALGDLRGYDMYTHTARDDADVAYRTVFKDREGTIADRIVPHAVFVDPEIAAVGLTEQKARDAGHDVAIGVQQFTGVAKAMAMGETRGFIKFVADATTDRILGCHIVGPEAGNLVHEAVVAMTADIPYSEIGRAVHIHPTLAEGVNAAAGGVHRPSSG